MTFLEQTIVWAEEVGWVWGSIYLFLGSLVEYVFPPFPGDTITVVGAAFIPTAGWPWAAVWFATISGSVVGASLNWRLGVWIASSPEKETWFHRWVRRPRVASKISRVVSAFEARGPIFLAVNRFVPAFRAVFFIAAGMANISLGRTVFWAAVSSALWGAALMVVGSAIGFQIDRLALFVSRYFEVMTCVLLFAFIVWWLLDSRKTA